MIPDILYNDLSCGAKFAVWCAWQSAKSKLGKEPDEVDHIYSMTTVGIKKLYEVWAPILQKKSISLRVTGVFCHQTPKAYYLHPKDGQKSPELGDLLIVHEHTTPNLKGPITKRRAVLLQAKMVDQGVTKNGKVDQYQEYLYENWPSFTLKGRGPSKGIQFLPGARNFQLGTGRYALIERNCSNCMHFALFCCCPSWTYSEATHPIRSAGGEGAGSFIANMLFDTNWSRRYSIGIPIIPLALLDAMPNNHFDITVQELLTITAQKTLLFKNKPYISGTRGVFECMQLMEGPVALLADTGASFFTSVGGSGEVLGLRGEEDFDDGISTILIETGSEE